MSRAIKSSDTGVLLHFNGFLFDFLALYLYSEYTVNGTGDDAGHSQGYKQFNQSEGSAILSHHLSFQPEVPG